MLKTVCILIGGDSWTLGEYRFHPDVNDGCWSHLGLVQYLMDEGHLVKNVGKGGSSNNDSITALKTAIENSVYKFEYIFWFQTDPIRDLRPYTDPALKNIKTYQQLIEKQNECLLDSYRNLDSIGSKIYVIGGCAKINLDLISQFHNLEPIIPSVTEFLIPHYTHPEYVLTDNSEREECFNLDASALDNLLDNWKKQSYLSEPRSMINDPLVRKYFLEDGAHINRWGHLEIFNYMCQKLNLRKTICKSSR